MEFAKLILNNAWGSYTCTESSGEKMTILGILLANDVGDNILSYKQTLADNTLSGHGGNFTFLEKEGNYICLSDLYSEEDEPTELKMTRQQFVQLLDDWQEKVCKHKSKTVIIKYENDQFTIDTSDDDN